MTTYKADLRNDHWLALVNRYQPKAYAGDMDMFLGEDAIHGAPAFWRLLVSGRFRVHRVPGKRLTLIDKDHANDFARVLKEVLREAEVRAGRSSGGERDQAPACQVGALSVREPGSRTISMAAATMTPQAAGDFTQTA